MILLGFTLPAAFLNLGLTYSASRLLGAEHFGIFYTGITAGNILFAPSVVLNLFFSRFVAGVLARRGPEEADRTLWFIFRFIGKWLGLVSILAVVAVLLVGTLGPQFSVPLALMIVLVVYTSYLGETGRILLQGTQRFIRLRRLHLGLDGFALCARRGCIVDLQHRLGGSRRHRALCPAPLCALLWAATGTPCALPDTAESAQDLTSLIPFGLGYGLFAAAAHVDILIAYF